jgi:CheY-like chemotaxis protein
VDTADDRAVRRRHRILLAEDDEQFRLLLTEVLANADYDVVPCHDGLDLLDKIVTFTSVDEPTGFDLIISDLRMPGIDGLSLVEALQPWEEVQFVPVVLITAFGNPTLHREAEALGITVLDKPFEIDALLAKVRELLPPQPDL